MEFYGFDIGDALSLVITIIALTLHHKFRRRAEKRLDTPQIMGYLRKDDMNSCCLVAYVENVGTGTAEHVRFKTSDNSLRIFGDTTIGDIGFIKNGIRYFGKGQKYEFLINTTGRWDELKQNPLIIDVEYWNSAGKKEDEKIYLEFAPYDGNHLPTSPIGRIAKTTEKMIKATSSVATAVNRVSHELKKHITLRVGDKVKTATEIDAPIYRNGILVFDSIPEGSICTVIEVRQKDITIEWDGRGDDERVVRCLELPLNGLFEMVHMNLPPKQR